MKTGNAVQDAVQKNVVQSLHFYSDDDIVSNALEHMHELFESKGGHPTKASCVYELTENTPIRLTTKVYYTTSYHKKPISAPKTFHDELTANRTVKITFKKNDKMVELFEKGSRGTRRVEIEIPAIFQT